MVFMNAIAEIDKSGRVVVPKKLRDALHLAPGTRFRVRTAGNGILLEPEVAPRGLFRKNGILVYDSGRPTPPEAVDWVRQDREERINQVGQ